MLLIHTKGNMDSGDKCTCRVTEVTKCPSPAHFHGGLLNQQVTPMYSQLCITECTCNPRGLKLDRLQCTSREVIGQVLQDATLALSCLDVWQSLVAIFISGLRRMQSVSPALDIRTQERNSASCSSDLVPQKKRKVMNQWLGHSSQMWGQQPGLVWIETAWKLGSCSFVIDRVFTVCPTELLLVFRELSKCWCCPLFASQLSCKL